MPPCAASASAKRRPSSNSSGDSASRGVPAKPCLILRPNPPLRLEVHLGFIESERGLTLTTYFPARKKSLTVNEPPVKSTSEDSFFVLAPVRPLRLFGKRMTVRRGTALSFCPTTVFHAATGLSWMRELEKRDIRAYRALLALQRTEQEGSRMQRGMRQDLARTMAPADAPHGLTPDELFALPEHLANPWRLLFRGVRRQLHRVDRRLLVRLALAERITHSISTTHDPEENARRRRLVFLPSLEYWSTVAVKLPWQAILPLDSALHHLAWLDAEISVSTESWRRGAAVLSLSNPVKPAMRHWFDGLLHLTGCDDLAEFEKYLAARGVQTRGEILQHGRLKKWASSIELMPNQQAVAILSGCGSQVDAGLELRRFWCARLLAFLGEVVYAFAESAPKEDQDVREALHNRLVQLRAAFPEPG